MGDLKDSFSALSLPYSGLLALDDEDDERDAPLLDVAALQHTATATGSATDDTQLQGGDHNSGQQQSNTAEGSALDGGETERVGDPRPRARQLQRAAPPARPPPPRQTSAAATADLAQTKHEAGTGETSEVSEAGQGGARLLRHLNDADGLATTNIDGGNRNRDVSTSPPAAATHSNVDQGGQVTTDGIVDGNTFGAAEPDDATIADDASSGLQSPEPMGPIFNTSDSGRATPDLVADAVAAPAIQAPDQKVMAGWLMKLGAKGLRRAWRRRWFVFDPRQCVLFYYRSAQFGAATVQPAGYIDMSASTLSFVQPEQRVEAATPETTDISYAQFSIHCMDRTFQLMAENNSAMMSWMSGLQAHRQAFLADATKPSNTERFLAGPTLDEGNTRIIGSADTSTTLSRSFNAIANRSVSLANRLTNISSQSSKPASDEEDESPMSPPPPSEPGRTRTNRPSLANFGLGFIKRKRHECSECERRQQLLDTLTTQLETAQAECVQSASLLSVLTVKAQAKESAAMFSQLGAEEQKLLFEQQQEQIVRLQTRLEEVSAARHESEQTRRAADAQLRQVTEREELLQERHVQMKELVERLTSELDTRPAASGIDAPPVEVVLDPLTEDLKHRCQVFETQNAFLNAELVALSDQRRHDEQRHRREIEHMRDLDDRLRALRGEHAELLRMSCEGIHLHEEQLIQMAEQTLQTERLRETPELGGTKVTGPVQYDEYGFAVVRDLAGALHRLRKDDAAPAAAAVSRWATYFVSRGTAPFAKGQTMDGIDQLKFLVRGGIPDQYRGRMWTDMINFIVKGNRRFHGPGYYQKLCSDDDAQTTVAVQQIELDLLRTFPTHKHFSDESSLHTRQLRQVLVAYSRHNPVVGYCQGLNMIAGLALLFLDEEEAFWCLVAVVEHLQPPGYYTSGMITARADQRVLVDLMKERLPKLHAHLEKHTIDLTLITFNWFLTVFVECVPTKTALRIWDIYLYEGPKAPFRFALGILKLNEQAILKLQDKTQIFSFLKSMAKHSYDVHTLCKTSFQSLEGWQGFSMKNIQSKRFIRTEQVQAEADALQKLREERAAKRASVISSSNA